MNEKEITFILQKMEEEEIRNVYEIHMKKDFPPDELKPLKAIFAMLERGFYDCFGFYEEGKLKAYAFFVIHPQWEVGLLDYLAVCEPYRGSGIGGKCLRAVKDYYKDKKGILLECESVDSGGDPQEIKIREQRIRFYERNGCRKTDVKSRLFGVEYTILYMPFHNQEIQALEELERVYREMFPEKTYEKQVAVFK